MSPKTAFNEFGFLRLDSRKKTPLFRQLYNQLRNGILQGRLKAECRIPSSRDLMEQLAVSRTTIVTALDLLIAEGYLHTLRGRGTFVSSEIPDEQILPAGMSPEEIVQCSKKSNHLSDYGKTVQDSDRTNWFTGTPIPFCPGEPALDEFPISIWSKIVRRVWKSLTAIDLSYGEPAGYFPLRSQIAEYLSVHRGVNCDTEQVMIVNGTQQAVDIVARIALNPGDQVLFENPGYISARSAFQKHGAEIVPLWVDDDGAMVEDAVRNFRTARLAYITPSHQFPMGVTLPIERRLELINWAQENDSLILEDDYDSEYRYSQKPLPCLQGLDRAARTIYVGSFSKVVFPALGLGYAIVPKQMVTAFQNALRLSSRPGSQVDQIVLSEFIREGHFVRHLRRMRKTHAFRRDVFVAEIQKHLADQLTVVGSSAGLHCTTILKTKTPDVDVAQRLEERGIIARPLSGYYAPGTWSRHKQNGLVLGFACVPPAIIRKKIKDVALTII
jgi:GntR family transcriptional regulator/MocR family aminotransferase